MYDPRLNFKRGFPFGGSFSKNGGTFLIFGGTIKKIGGSFFKNGGPTTYSSKLTSAYFALKSVLLIVNVATLYTCHITTLKTM